MFPTLFSLSHLSHHTTETIYTCHSCGHYCITKGARLTWSRLLIDLIRRWTRTRPRGGGRRTWPACPGPPRWDGTPPWRGNWPWCASPSRRPRTAWRRPPFPWCPGRAPSWRGTRARAPWLARASRSWARRRPPPRPRPPRTSRGGWGRRGARSGGARGGAAARGIGRRRRRRLRGGGRRTSRWTAAPRLRWSSPLREAKLRRARGVERRLSSVSNRWWARENRVKRIGVGNERWRCGGTGEVCDSPSCVKNSPMPWICWFWALEMSRISRIFRDKIQEDQEPCLSHLVSRNLPATLVSSFYH